MSATWVGWGGAITLMFTCTHKIDIDRLHYDIFSCPCQHTHTPLVATLSYLLLHLHNDGMLLYDISCACTILDTRTFDAKLWYLLLHLHNLTHTHLMLRYDIFPGTESTNGFLGTIWQSDNWPTTWKNGNRQIKLFVVKSSKHIIHEVHKWGVFVHWSQKRKGARIPVTMFKAMLWRLAPISDLSFRFVPK